MTFINVTTSGIATGTLLAPNADGFEKKIMASSIVTGGIYRLYCPVGILLDPSTGSTVAKYIDFQYPGQSIYLIWDNLVSCYITISASACCFS
jgi:hypothetical protein